MRTGRLEAFSDGVLAILITIMVLELKVPHGADWEALHQLFPALCAYVLSFVYIGIYWNNHHHMLHACDHVTGGMLWANLHLLFWLSLVPVATDWMGEHHSEPLPSAIYGAILLAAGIAYVILQNAIIRSQGANSKLRALLGKDMKGKLSPILYLLGIGSAFVHTTVSQTIYASVAAIWLIPDRRIEGRIAES